MKIGIIGGSFNPPHILHRQMGEEALKHHLVDKVIYVPTGDKYAKETLIEGKYRYQMLKLMCQENPLFEVSDYEIRKGSSYTYETLAYFQKKYPQDEIYFILSTDLLLDMMNWKNPKEILKKYHMIGLKRKGIFYQELPTIYKQYAEHVQFYDFQMEELSSTQIRQAMYENRLSWVQEHVPQPVFQYIRKNHLYQSIENYK